MSACLALISTYDPLIETSFLNVESAPPPREGISTVWPPGLVPCNLATASFLTMEHFNIAK